MVNGPPLARTVIANPGGGAKLVEFAVADDLTAGRLREIRVSALDLRRTLRAVWVGSRTPPAGAARDLIAIAASSSRASAPAGQPSGRS